MAWLRCPRCTKKFKKPQGTAIICPSCGHEGEVGPGDYEPAPNLDDLVPGEVHEVTGRPRDTFIVVLLSIFLFPIYPLVWLFRAYRELDRQHGRLHATWLYLFGLLFIVPMFIYMGVEAARLQAYRRSRGMKPGPGALSFLTLSILLPVIGFWIGVALQNGSMHTLWRRIYKEHKVRLPP